MLKYVMHEMMIGLYAWQFYLCCLSPSLSLYLSHRLALSLVLSLYLLWFISRTVDDTALTVGAVIMLYM